MSLPLWRAAAGNARIPASVASRNETLSPDTKRSPARGSFASAPKNTPADETDFDPIENEDHGPGLDADSAARVILASLEDDKAEDIQAIDIRGKSSVADLLVVASGRSQRHVGALADHVMRKLKEAGARRLRVEGLPACDWVLVDAGDVIVHLFRPEVRSFYNIEKIWSGAPSPSARAS